MQSENIHILSTRLLDEAATAKAADLNICFDSLSFINVQPIYSNELRNQLLLLATQSLYVAFTSGNAVSAVAECISHTNTNWKICCTGGKTREFVVQVFGEETIIASAKNANLLADRIIASRHVTKLTFFCGDQHLSDLSEKLKTQNIQTDEIIVYKTLLTPVFIEKNYDGILFFSPTAAHSFFSLNTVPVDSVLFSIGLTTTAVIQSYCTNKIITSDWPGTESLVSLVADFYNTASHEAI